MLRPVAHYAKTAGSFMSEIKSTAEWIVSKPLQSRVALFQMKATRHSAANRITPCSKMWHAMAAGVVAGCVTRTATSPLDVIKILVQVDTHRGSVHTTCRNLYQIYGMRGFWRGNLAGCCRLGAYSGIKFGVFDQLQTMRDPYVAPSALGWASCGAVAGFVATIAVYPMELVRTRLIVLKEASSIAQECIRVLHSVGMRGFYRGCFAGLVGAIPFEGIQFASYECGKSYITDHRWPASRWPTHKVKLDSVDHLVLGSLSGALAQMAAYPFDTIKKQLQLQAASKVGCKSMRACVDQILREQGISGFYRGSLTNMVRLVPYAALMFTSYEATMDLLKAL
ncbi:Aste57867_16529 [Aphanomyces stellatus]|uniref:Aste57867_16529 protein n=1 Tax=Aphanomyces stellatus TaxID=120398 RepID=A0A485L782_9STRA|nr:hypothetical protein As57867_016472 [Aphanomyces stellatus]VFT93303.1 Aste57867_16529 [Aphanomyces stellatus]